MSDREILKLYRKNDHKGIRAAFDKYYHDLCIYATGIAGELPVAEDIVQTVFIKCWKDKCFLNIQSSLKSYLYTSVRNGCLNHIKKQHANPHHPITEHISGEITAPPDHLPDPEMLAALDRAIAGLPGKCKEVFLLVVARDKSYMEAATELHITVNTVKTQLSRAMRKIRHQMEPFFRP